MVAHSPIAGSADGRDSDLDPIFALLANRRRRYALACLDQHTQAIGLADLAEEIAVRENEEPISSISEMEVKRIYLSLYHQGIPKLADAGAIEYDRDRNLVRASETVDPIDRVRSFAAEGGGER